MSCELVRETLIDLGLDPATRERVASALDHLRDCADCRAAVHDYDLIAAALREGGRPSPATNDLSDDSTERATHSATHSATQIIGPVFSRSSVWDRLRLLVAVAAAIVIAAGGFWIGRFRARAVENTSDNAVASRHGPIAAPPISPSFEPPSTAEVAECVRAFDEVNGVYEGRTRWMLLSDSRSDLGIEPSIEQVDAVRPASGPTAKKMVLLRLKLLRGPDVVSDADLVIVMGNVAEWVVTTKIGPSLHYRVATSATSPGQLELRAELRAPNALEAEAALATHLQLSPDRATSAGRLVTPDGAYDLAVSYAVPL